MLSALFTNFPIQLPFEIEKRNYLYFFADDSKILVSLNPAKPSISNYPLNISSNRGHAGVLCYLPKSKLFYGGGFLKNKALADYIIIDELQGIVESIPGGRPRKQAGSLFLSPFVYIFGGCEGDKPMKNCERFNTKTKK